MVEPSRVRFDLRPGSPDLSAFPVAAWLSAARKALRTAPFETLGYGDPQGTPELRRALADYLARARGVQAAPEHIVVCSGFGQGLTLLCSALRARGARVVAVESYGLVSQHQAVTASGLLAETVTVDDDGAVVDEFASFDAALLTPAHQFPIGSTLAAQRRLRAVEWARATGGLLIEDDYDGEFRYDRQPLGAMQALAPKQVTYGGTASKSLAPGLRLGWLVLPPDLLEHVLAAKRLTDGPSTLEQLTMAEFITSGEYDRHIRRSRLSYRRRRDKLVATLHRQAPDARVTGIDAGLHALIELSNGQTEEQVIDRARSGGLLLDGLDTYRLGAQQHTPALVIGYGTPPEHAFSATLARLSAALAST